MSIQDRNTLKGFFRKGQKPSESNFHDLIDSLVNRVDDGLSKNTEDGLMLSPSGSSLKMISFFKSIQEKSSVWSIDLNKGNSHLSFTDMQGTPVLTITPEIRVGIGNDNPAYELDVDGTVGMKARLGTYAQGKFPADGNWHQVLTGLKGVYGFEIVAGVGKKKTGKYALAHAFAMSTYGKSKSKIRITQGFYGSRKNRIQFKWTGDTFNFNLEMRTRSDYEGEFLVQYFISELWTDKFMDDSYEGE